MLCCVFRFSVICQRPVDSSVNPVNAVFFQEAICMSGMLHQLLISSQHITVGEKPENPAVQDTPFDRFLICHKIEPFISVISAKFLILQAFPERNDLMNKMIFYFLYKHHTPPYRIPLSVSVSETTLCSLI